MSVPRHDPASFSQLLARCNVHVYVNSFIWGIVNPKIRDTSSMEHWGRSFNVISRQFYWYYRQRQHGTVSWCKKFKYFSGLSQCQAPLIVSGSLLGSSWKYHIQLFLENCAFSCKMSYRYCHMQIDTSFICRLLTVVCVSYFCLNYKSESYVFTCTHVHLLTYHVLINCQNSLNCWPDNCID